MKVIDRVNETKKPLGISAVIFSLIPLGFVIYALLISDQNCLRYFTRRGLIEDCSDDKMTGMASLSFMAILGLIFLVVGLINLKRRKPL